MSGIQAALISAHVVLATVTKNPLWALDPAEAKNLADAINNVTRHHDIAVAQKTIDYTNLAVVAGMVYGTRLLALQRARSTAMPSAPDSDAAAQVHASGGNVHPFTGQMQ